MSDDTIGGIVVTAVAALVVGLFASYWIQRRRFTRGDDPVIVCQVRWWNGPLGLGWRQALLRLGEDRLAYQRRISFRARPQLVLARAELTFMGRTAPRGDDWIWIADSDVITVATHDRRLRFAFLAGDGEVFLAWLGVEAPHPPATGASRATLIAVLASLALGVVVLVFSDPKPWAVLALPVGVALWTLGASLIHARIRVSHALDDRFVNEATETFGFLRDFGFDDAYVQHFPWQTTLAFTGSSDRMVVLAYDRRNRILDLSFGRRGDPALRTLRAVLEEAGHPDPGRVTHCDDAAPGAALNANAHALRLWGRPFLARAADVAPGG